MATYGKLIGGSPTSTVVIASTIVGLVLLATMGIYALSTASSFTGSLSTMVGKLGAAIGGSAGTTAAKIIGATVFTAMNLATFGVLYKVFRNEHPQDRMANRSKKNYKESLKAKQDATIKHRQSKKDLEIFQKRHEVAENVLKQVTEGYEQQAQVLKDISETQGQNAAINKKDAREAFNNLKSTPFSLPYAKLNNATDKVDKQVGKVANKVGAAARKAASNAQKVLNSRKSNKGAAKAA